MDQVGPTNSHAGETMDVDSNLGVTFETAHEGRMPGPRARNMTVEEVPNEDEDESPDNPRNFARFVEAFPVEPHRLKKGTTQFEEWQKENVKAGRHEWSPFESEAEWETVCWLVANVGQSAVEDYRAL